MWGCSSSTCRPMPPPCPVARSSPPAGEVVGEHDGFARFTIGQRKRLPGGFSDARYVVAIRPEAREVVIGSLDDLEGHRVTLEEVNWLSPAARAGRCMPGPGPLPGAGGVPATVIAAGDGRVELALETAVRAISPGQSGVLYNATERVIGGGVIA